MPTLDRQRELARKKLERQMKNRAQAAARRRQMWAAVGAACALLLLVGGVFLLKDQFAGDDSDDKAASPSASSAPSAAPSLGPGECAYAKSTDGKVKNVGTPAVKNVAHEGVRTAKLATSVGDLTFELDRAKAPCTVNSFTFLAGKKYLDNTECHRLTTSGIFVLQCGDPSATGTGGPGYKFPEENLPKDGEANYPKGSLAMANAGPGTNGSQFFIVYKDTKLPPSYTIFGKVTAGLDKVEKVAATGVDGGSGDGKPKTAVKISKVTLGDE